MAETQPYGVRNRRPSATDNLINAAKSFESKVEQSLLILWDDLPAWRRDNAFILSGYRQSHGSYAHSFRSLFYLHNESVNIWSHLLGAIVFLASAAYVDRVVRPRYESASSADVLVFACFFGGAVVCLGMSATYHTLSNHSDTVSKWGNKLDYTGIVALIVGSYVPALYYGFFCLPNLMASYKVDMYTRSWMHNSFMGRALPDPRMASVSCNDVHRPWSLWRCSCHPWPLHL